MLFMVSESNAPHAMHFLWVVKIYFKTCSFAVNMLVYCFVTAYAGFHYSPVESFSLAETGAAVLASPASAHMLTCFLLNF